MFVLPSILVQKRLHFETCGSGESLVSGSKQSFATTGLGRYLICGSEKRLRSDLRFVVRRNVKLSQSALGSQTRLVTSGICNHLSCSLVHQLPEPKKDGASFLFAAFLFWIVYVMNALLDGEYGCEHGSFYDRLGSAN